MNRNDIKLEKYSIEKERYEATHKKSLKEKNKKFKKL